MFKYISNICKKAFNSSYNFLSEKTKQALTVIKKGISYCIGESQQERNDLLRSFLKMSSLTAINVYLNAIVTSVYGELFKPDQRDEADNVDAYFMFFLCSTAQLITGYFSERYSQDFSNKVANGAMLYYIRQLNHLEEEKHSQLNKAEIIDNLNRSGAAIYQFSYYSINLFSGVTNIFFIVRNMITSFGWSSMYFPLLSILVRYFIRTNIEQSLIALWKDSVRKTEAITNFLIKLFDRHELMLMSHAEDNEEEAYRKIVDEMHMADLKLSARKKVGETVSQVSLQFLQASYLLSHHEYNTSFLAILFYQSSTLVKSVNATFIYLLGWENMICDISLLYPLIGEEKFVVTSLSTDRHASSKGMEVSVERVFATSSSSSSSLKAACVYGSYPESKIQTVEFKQVSFFYNDQKDHKILDAISHHFTPGSTTFILGKNGSGKSTLAKILVGLYKPKEGSYYIGDDRVDALDIYAHRRKFFYCSQNTDRSLMDSTIRNNLFYGRSEVEVERESKYTDDALESVGLDPRDWPMERQVQISKLSGGEKQKLVLARLFLNNYSFFVLDEPTSQVDVTSRSKFWNRFFCYAKYSTKVIVTHDLEGMEPFLKLADQIIILDNARIIAHGQHSHLMSENACYRTLFNHKAEVAVMKA